MLRFIPSLTLTLVLIVLLPYSTDTLPLNPNQTTRLETDPPIPHTTAAVLSRWYRVRKAAHTEYTQIVIAIKHASPQQLEQLFWTVSDPSSPTYGRFLELSELSKFVAPSPVALNSVTSWLSRNGVDLTHSCAFSPLREFLSCQITVGTLHYTNMLLICLPNSPLVLSVLVNLMTAFCSLRSSRKAIHGRTVRVQKRREAARRDNKVPCSILSGLSGQTAYRLHR